MKKIFVLALILFAVSSQAQPPKLDKKYQSLLWEITGKSLKKPSYLFGTMHVSSKMAFHLADSFYLGLRNADVVALENNPESWQEDMSRFGVTDNGYRNQRRFGLFLTDQYNDFLTSSTLKFYNYDSKLKRALYSSPSMINSLLYRSYGDVSSDFEEDTYLDMYLYQCGKKWGKRIAGVENYEESLRLAGEAYRDAAKDKNRKTRNYGNEESFGYVKLQEAYRTGNLDWLDSINKYNSASAAFDEKFLYKRNEIQANSIDSIIAKGSSLFVGVGAAHLPGKRGVIELLRRMGYTLRPVKMGQRDSQHKLMVEKIRVPLVFTTQTSADGVYKVDMPGKLYKTGEDAALAQSQYSDMANGSYYMVTRVMTNAWMYDHDPARVYAHLDSVLYENIPGRIISKKSITKNGYRGVDVVNRTRRGDLQRYNIFVTPFEIIVFKVSGTGEYVQQGPEAEKFFSSIRLMEYSPATVGDVWKKFSPVYGGFSIDLPHTPFAGNDGSFIYDAEDKKAGIDYRVVQSDIHNYSFVEEDSFDLTLMNESFATSDYIDSQMATRKFIYKGLPAMESSFRDKRGGIYSTRYIINGPHYYTLIAHSPKATDQTNRFFNSFEIQPFKYGAAIARKDTSLYFTVNSAVYPVERPNPGPPAPSLYGGMDDDDDEDDSDNVFKSKIISNDSTGEKIFISVMKSDRYQYYADSSLLIGDEAIVPAGSSWITRMKKNYQLPGGISVREAMISDTNSSRMIWNKSYYQNGMMHLLVSEGDTLSKPSSFIETFYQTFLPLQTMKGSNPFEKKTDLFFADLASSDSILHKRAVKQLSSITIDTAHFVQLTQVINGLTWKEKRYLETKKAFIAKLDNIRTKEASDYLTSLYYAAGDTLDLQYAALETLLQQKTQYAYKQFKEIISVEPPVLNVQDRGGSYSDYISPLIPGSFTRNYNSFSYNNNSFIDELTDTLELTRAILPSLIPLLNLEDYKQPVMHVLKELIDEGLIKPKDISDYTNRFLLEAKQEYKKQVISEKQKSIAMEEKKGEDDNRYTAYDVDNENFGNAKLLLYSSLLMPSIEKNKGVAPFVYGLLASNDKRLKYDIMLLLIKNNKAIPDTLLNYFANMDEYRYELYQDLKEIKKVDKFPPSQLGQVALLRSKLIGQSLYSRPDSIVFLEKRIAKIKNVEGYFYFYKYQKKGDEQDWKFAYVGLVPLDEKLVEFESDNKTIPGWHTYVEDGYVTTATASDVKVKDDEPLAQQLDKLYKRILYSKHKSAVRFYNNNDYQGNDYLGLQYRE